MACKLPQLDVLDWSGAVSHHSYVCHVWACVKDVCDLSDKSQLEVKVRTPDGTTLIEDEDNVPWSLLTPCPSQSMVLFQEITMGLSIIIEYM